MDEARRRKLTDPTYGKLRKGGEFRGLVVSPPVRIDGTYLHAKSSSLDPQELRFALLFWDRLAWPASRGIHFGSNADEQFLEQAGVLKRPEFFFPGDQAQALINGQIKIFDDLDRETPGAWAMAQGENSLLVMGGTLEAGRGATVELHRAIPIPKHDVPLAEILEFKRRRRDELLVLRSQLEGLSAEIESASDMTAALQGRVAEIDAACANLIAVGREWQFPVYLANLKATMSLNVPRAAAATYGAWKAGEAFSLTAAATAAASVGAASLVDIKGDIGFRSPKKTRNPYRYAYSMHGELR